jgi:hypothetical protein
MRIRHRSLLPQDFLTKRAEIALFTIPSDGAMRREEWAATGRGQGEGN